MPKTRIRSALRRDETPDVASRNTALHGVALRNTAHSATRRHNSVLRSLHWVIRRWTNGVLSRRLKHLTSFTSVQFSGVSLCENGWQLSNHHFQASETPGFCSVIIELNWHDTTDLEYFSKAKVVLNEDCFLRDKYSNTEQKVKVSTRSTCPQYLTQTQINTHTYILTVKCMVSFSLYHNLGLQPVVHFLSGPLTNRTASLLLNTFTDNCCSRPICLDVRGMEFKIHLCTLGLGVGLRLGFGSGWWLGLQHLGQLA